MISSSCLCNIVDLRKSNPNFSLLRFLRDYGHSPVWVVLEMPIQLTGHMNKIRNWLIQFKMPLFCLLSQTVGSVSACQERSCWKQSQQLWDWFPSWESHTDTDWQGCALPEWGPPLLIRHPSGWSTSRKASTGAGYDRGALEYFKIIFCLGVLQITSANNSGVSSITVALGSCCLLYDFDPSNVRPWLHPLSFSCHRDSLSAHLLLFKQLGL